MNETKAKFNEVFDRLSGNNEFRQVLEKVTLLLKGIHKAIDDKENASALKYLREASFGTAPWRSSLSS